MIIFLYGADSFRSKEKLNEIVAQYKAVKKSALNLIWVDAKEHSFEDFHNHFKISSMFAETKLVIVKNVFADKKFQEDFLEELKNLQAMKDVIVVYENEAPDARLKLFKSLLKEGKSQEFALLDARNTKLWAQKAVEKAGAKINNDALELLVNCVGNDLWRLSNEIGKLVSLSARNSFSGIWDGSVPLARSEMGGKSVGVIQKADVELLVKPNIESDIFKTIDALAQRNKPQALAMLHKHLDGDDNPLYLLSMIAFQFKNLLMVKELSEKGLMYDSIVKKSGLHPFVVKKSYFLCRQFSFAELKKIYRRIFDTDSDIKVGKVDAETALDLFVSKI